VYSCPASVVQQNALLNDRFFQGRLPRPFIKNLSGMADYVQITALMTSWPCTRCERSLKPLAICSLVHGRRIGYHQDMTNKSKQETRLIFDLIFKRLIQEASPRAVVA
jgi:hypothetical protein